MTSYLFVNINELAAMDGHEFKVLDLKIFIKYCSETPTKYGTSYIFLHEY